MPRNNKRPRQDQNMIYLSSQLPPLRSSPNGIRNLEEIINKTELSETDFDVAYDGEGYLGEQDREELQQKSELQRESILAERWIAMERIARYKNYKSAQISQAVASSAAQTASSSHALPAAEDSAINSSEARAKSASTASDTSKETASISADKQATKVPDQQPVAEDSSSHSASAQQLNEPSSQPAIDKQRTNVPGQQPVAKDPSSHSASAQQLNERSSKPPASSSEITLTLKDLRHIILNRNQLQFLLNSIPKEKLPKALIGSFVKFKTLSGYCFGRITQVRALSLLPDPLSTSVQVSCGDSSIPVQLNAVSNDQVIQREFREWYDQASRMSQVPTTEQIRRKCKELTISTYWKPTSLLPTPPVDYDKLSTQELSRKVAALKSTARADIVDPSVSATLKDVSLALAKKKRTQELNESRTTQLQEKITKRNQQYNAQQARKQIQGPSTSNQGDPFTRKKTQTQNTFLYEQK